MATEVKERIVVAAPATEVFAAVANVRRMARWSPECFAVWIWRRQNGMPARFIGWNRSGPFVWFSSCQVRVAEPAVEFAFDVTTFGMPVARWGYRFSPTEDGTEVTEYWEDKRNRGATVLGRIFTDKSATMRPEVNREGMQVTLRRLKSELESGVTS
jgi:Polyketide cyclase / dehydrase and lipid transport